MTSREEFEAWESEIENFCTRGERVRDLGWTEAMWAAWQAARSTTPAAGPASPAVGGGELPEPDFHDNGDVFGNDLTYGYTRETVLRLLAAGLSSPAVGGGEAVAWQARKEGSGWIMCDKKLALELSEIGWDVRSLYTHPAASSEAVRSES